MPRKPPESPVQSLANFWSQNKQFKYILVVIDCFSKYTWTVPVKAKDSKHVTEAMKKVLSQIIHLPKNLQTDKGSEFYNSMFKALMKKYKMNITVHSVQKKHPLLNALTAP
jgi:hypothetical protein